MFASPPKPILLVIEETPVIAPLLETAVRSREDSWAEIVSAATSEEGLKTAADRRPEIIFLDWMLPPLHGEEFLAEQCRIPDIADLPVLVYSALEGTALSDLREFYPAVKTIIAKPLSSSKLFEAMKPHLKTRLLPRADRPPARD